MENKIAVLLSGGAGTSLLGDTYWNTEEGKKSVKVEIQIRTFVMHLWAELDHDKYYKKQKKDLISDIIFYYVFGFAF